MTRAVYYTATTLDGYIADEQDSLQWLFEQDIDQSGAGSFPAFISGVGALAMGATTYEWIREHMAANDEPWTYDVGCWVFTHRDLQSIGDGITFVQGDVREHHAALAEAAGERDIWVVGGGDLAGQFADHGLLDRVMVSIAPVTLGAGRPLFPRRHNLKLVETARNGDFVVTTYDVVGARTD